MEMKYNRIAQVGSAVVITAVLLALLLSQVNISDIVHTITNISPLYLAVGFILYLTTYFFRALRFYILLDRSIGIRDLFYIVCANIMISNILPAKTGELSYVYLLKKGHNRTTGEGIATLVVSRVMDILAISALFLFSAMMIGPLPEIVTIAVWIISCFSIAAFLVLIAVMFSWSRFIGTLGDLMVKYHVDNRPMNFIYDKLQEIADSFEVIQGRSCILGSFILSVLIWGIKYIDIYILMRAINIELALWIVVAGATLSLLLQTLPLPSIGGFGVTEGAWAIVYVPLGLSKEMAISSAFIIHIIIVVYYCVLGLIGIYHLKQSYSLNDSGA